MTRETVTVLSGFDPCPGAPPAPGTRPAGGLPFADAMRACQACGARQEARQVVVGVGPLDAVGMVIGQNPGVEEDAAGVPFIGAGGEVLDEWLARLGLDRAKLVVTNAVKCHTRDNRVPRPVELRTCFEQTLSKELLGLPDLKVLFPVGKPAVSILLHKAAPPMTPLMAHHVLIRVRDGVTAPRDLHVFPLPHPAFLLRARHLAALMQTVLSHVRLTLEQELPEAYARMRRK